VAVLAIPSEQWQNWGHTFGLVAASPTHTPSPTETSIPTATERPTPTDTPTIIPTTLDGDVFQDGQFGVVFADFTRIDSGVPNIEPNIISEFREADIPLVHVLYTLNDNEHACEVGSVYRASLVLWGEAALGGVRIFFEVLPCPLNGAGGDGGSVNVNEDQLFKDGEPQRFSTYIFEGMDTLYLAHFVKGQKAFFANDLSGALTAFQAAADLIPEGRENDVRAGTLYIYLGLVNDASGNYEQSIESYTRAIEFEPDNALAYYNRGNSYARQAITLLQQATSQSDADQAFDLFQSAIDDYDRAIDLEYIDLYQAYTNRGNALYFLQQYDEAAQSYSLALEDNPNYSLANLNRAVVYTVLGQTEQATADYGVWALSSEAIPAELGMAAPVTLAITPNDVYSLGFEGCAGQTISAQAYPVGIDVDPLLVLLDPAGAPLIADDDSAPSESGMAAGIRDYRLSAEGEYTLLLTHSTGGSQGDITVQLLTEIVSCEATPEATTEVTLSSAPPG
ncbi:MAG: tetratricopeptide repeat protein, partial [Burkholderiales bacterium]|nr:tetratricopeptide repeat protein [Anaerolineae bacterium]